MADRGQLRETRGSATDDCKFATAALPHGSCSRRDETADHLLPPLHMGGESGPREPTPQALFFAGCSAPTTREGGGVVGLERAGDPPPFCRPQRTGGAPHVSQASFAGNCGARFPYFVLKP